MPIFTYIRFERLKKQANLRVRNEAMHGELDLVVQAIVVTMPLKTSEEIAVVTNLMVLVLHLIDDPADGKLSDSFSKWSSGASTGKDWSRGTSAVEFLKEYFHEGYAELFRLSVAEVERVIPRFNRRVFERATIRMIRGGFLFSPQVSRARREEAQRQNKLEHIRKINRRRHPTLYHLMMNDISNVYYASAVKSLADAIFSFYSPQKKMDLALAIYLNIIAGPGVLYENVQREIDAGEFDPVEKPSPTELRMTLERTQAALCSEIKCRNFSRRQLEAFAEIFDIYNHTFAKILVRMGVLTEGTDPLNADVTSDVYGRLIFEVKQAIKTYYPPGEKKKKKK